MDKDVIMFSSIEFPQDWLGALSDLIHDEALGLPMKKVTALCMACVDDDPAAGMMLEQVLYWHGRNNGEFYMSARQWYDDYRITASRVRKAKKTLARCGVLTEIKKANGAPTTHYSLRPWRFIARLARVVKTTITALLNRFGGKQQIHSAESDKSLTIRTPKRNINKNDDIDSPLSFKKADSFVDTENPVYSLLLKQGVHEKVAKKFSHLDLKAVQDVVQQVSGFDAEYVPGGIVKRLKKIVTKPRKVVNDCHYSSPIEKKLDADDPALKIFKRDVVQRPEPNAEQLAVMVGDYTAGDVWRQMMNQMELQAKNIHDDLEHCELIGYASGEFIVWTRYETRRDYLQHRAYRIIERMLHDMSGEDVAVRYVLPDDCDKQDYASGEAIAGSDTR